MTKASKSAVITLSISKSVSEDLPIPAAAVGPNVALYSGIAGGTLIFILLILLAVCCIVRATVKKKDTVADILYRDTEAEKEMADATAVSPAATPMDIATPRVTEQMEVDSYNGEEFNTEEFIP